MNISEEDQRENRHEWVGGERDEMKQSSMDWNFDRVYACRMNLAEYSIPWLRKMNESFQCGVEGESEQLSNSHTQCHLQGILKPHHSPVASISCSRLTVASKKTTAFGYQADGAHESCL